MGKAKFDPDTGVPTLMGVDPTGVLRPLNVDASGNMLSSGAGTVGAKPPTSVFPNAPVNVTAANADTALTGANANRTGLIVSNDSTAKMYVLVDVSGSGAASATNFTYMIPSNGTLELPLVGGSVPTARIRGFWSATNGSAGVTDIS